MLFRKIIAVHYGNHTKAINTLCGQYAELFNVKEGGTYSYHCAINSTTGFESAYTAGVHLYFPCAFYATLQYMLVFIFI
jgi:hypothetical protein